MKLYRTSQRKRMCEECSDWLAQYASDSVASPKLLHTISVYVSGLYPEPICPDEEEEVNASVLMPEEEMTACEPNCVEYEMLPSREIRFRGEEEIDSESAEELLDVPAKNQQPVITFEHPIDEVFLHLLKLKRAGVTEAEIIQLVERVFQPSLTPLHVTRDYRLLLPGFDNAEFHLPPAEKALYLTFLSYPEGIRFSELIDYREEMLEFYNRISLRHDRDAASAVINRITEQGGNGINVSVSRINREVRQHCFGSLSQYYGIFGAQGEVKRIALPADMVCWE